jgi:hypothetical protein
MNRRLPALAYVILGLIAIGLLYRLLTNPSGMIIPVIVFGGVFLLYKFPPSRWQRSKPTPSSRYAKSREKRKPAPFRVIQGTKPDDDETPKFH